MEEKPIALEAFNQLAEAYAARIDTKAHNAFYDRPAVLSLLPPVGGKRVLDAACGPGGLQRVAGRPRGDGDRHRPLFADARTRPGAARRQGFVRPGRPGAAARFPSFVFLRPGPFRPDAGLPPRLGRGVPRVLSRAPRAGA